MKLLFRDLFLFLLLLAALFPDAAAGQKAREPFMPQQGQRLVLLGNTFAERMRHYNYFETLLQQSYPGLQLRLRNMGWSADEVGLQPRPLNFPGFKTQVLPPITGSQEVSFQRYPHEQASINMPVALNFAGLNQDLSEQQADIILLCFGMNEAFRGLAGLEQFQKDLLVFIRNLQSHRYNGHTPPVLVLVSPIAHENLGGYLPDPAAHNKNLALYTRAMQQTAQSQGLLFIDLFTPSMARMQDQSKPAITINGIHLNDAGYRLAATWMGQALGFPRKAARFDSPFSRQLRQLIKMKDDHFFYRWRAVNGEYIYGRRREPFGVIAFPPELRKLEEMTFSLDSLIWAFGPNPKKATYQKALAIVDRRGKPLDPRLVPQVPMVGRQGAAARAAAGHQHPGQKQWPATTESFRLPKGYEINLFASEKDFPIEEPVAMNFDARGRLWVATMPTYPQYFPGIPVHDQIIILEDTDQDGKADKHTVFADDLYLPLGFEFGNGGVYVSQEPDILFLKDTDGDDKADVREVVLSGFGSEDSHHATHAFTWGPDGALYFNEGTFLNTQVETPYGPVRSYAGATYRYQVRSGKLEHYISYPYYNPWGSVFDGWGMHLIGDASDGSNYFAPPMTGKIDYPAKHPRLDMFTTTRVRPTAGIEIISSGHFPPEVQGDFLVNNNIGFQGTKQHQIIARGSGITSKEVEPLLQSSDPNFRPIDLEFGPDGALYLVDWYNPLVSHGENPPRDPARDKTHGRVWRITYPGRPLLPVADLSRQSLEQLLENLKAPEDRLRYRSRMQLREKSAAEVLPALKSWLAALDPQGASYERYLLEGLWLYQDFDVVEPALLHTLLQARDYRARTAATRVLRYWKDRVPDALQLMRARVNDASPRVRLEAVVALSYFEGLQAIAAALDALQHPGDYYLDYALGETLKYLKPTWLMLLKQNQAAGFSSGKALPYLLGLCTSAELINMPASAEVLRARLSRHDLEPEARRQALSQLARLQNLPAPQIVLPLLEAAALKSGKQNDQTGLPADLVSLLLSCDPVQLRATAETFHRIIRQDSSRALRPLAYAALLAAGQADKQVQSLSRSGLPQLEDYLKGIALLEDKALQAAFYPEISQLASRPPQNLARSAAGTTYYPVQALAYSLLLQLPEQKRSNASLLGSFIGLLEKTPASQQNTAAFSKAVSRAQSLLVLVAEKDRPGLKARLEEMETLELRLVSVEAKMAFDKKEFTVPAGKKISLVFENPDLMPHNVVIVSPGSVEKVGAAADAMARLEDGFERNFVPALPEVLFATPLVNSGKSYRLNFKAPQQAGAYPFICSFPGHWRVMQGLLIVQQQVAGK